MVREAVTSRIVTELHVVPKRTSVDTEYYIRKVLEKSLFPSLTRTSSAGSIPENKMVPGMSSAIFQQNKVPVLKPKEAE